MQVRDLIEELERFDPNAKVTANFMALAQSEERGVLMEVKEVASVEGVIPAAGEPQLICR